MNLPADGAPTRQTGVEYRMMKDFLDGLEACRAIDKTAICRDTLAIMMTELRRVHSFFLTVVCGWCVLIVAAPLLKFSGPPPEIADTLYAFFSRICHQFDDRSFHVDGEKFAVCIRCFSIYVSFLAALALYPLLNPWHRGRIPSVFCLFAAGAPMVIDVALNLSGLSSSTEWSRLVTGALFGAILPFYIFPPLAEAALQLMFLRKGVPNAGKAK